MIEARGAKHAYLYNVSAIRRPTGDVYINHSKIFDTADSDDEAFGRAMKFALAVYPHNEGWGYHHAILTQVDGIGWVGKYDLTTIKPAEVP